MEVILSGSKPRPDYALCLESIGLVRWRFCVSPDAEVIKTFWDKDHEIDVPEPRELFGFALSFSA